MSRTVPVLLALSLFLAPVDAGAVGYCGGVSDTCPCGGPNPYPCCDNGGNCTWWAWHQACCNWSVPLPGWGNAKTWVVYAAANDDYEVLSTPIPGSIGCRTSGTYGHVAWVESVEGDRVTVTEMGCFSSYGWWTHTYDASYFSGGYIVQRGQGACSTEDGSLLRAPNESTVYYVLRGRRWSIASAEVFEALGLDWADVCTPYDETIGSLPEGPVIGGHGGLFRCPDCGSEVWRVDGRVRRWVQSALELSCGGWSLDDVFDRATPALLAMFPRGDDIVADCEPGDESHEPCGACGARSRTCQQDCHWGAWGECTAAGECAAGSDDTTPCGACGVRWRECSAVCEWGEWSVCRGEGDCVAGSTESEPCGRCGLRTRTCGDECEWGALGECAGEGPCAPGDEDSQPCGACGVQHRTCGDDCQWTAWDSCEALGECLEGEIQRESCGDCGERARTCTSACTWGSWGECQTWAECSPGAVDTRACGACGEQRRVCGEACYWGPWDTCGAEGSCPPGGVEWRDCGACGRQRRDCGDSCGWGEWSQCQYQGDCFPGGEEREPCGLCGERVRTCDDACGWSVWGACSDDGICAAGDTEQEPCGACGRRVRQCGADCQWSTWGGCSDEGACASGAEETRICADGCGVETRTCGESCGWGPWSPCDFEAPCEADDLEARPCARCGVETRSCVRCIGWTDWTECDGTGACEPGEVESEACDNGCGERRRECGVDCVWDAWTACPSEEDHCDDGDPCTTDRCLGGTCANVTDPFCCLGEHVCPEPTNALAYTCQDGVCVAEVIGPCLAHTDCRDGDPCTQDRCDVESGACAFTAIDGCCGRDADCDDGDSCTTERCGEDDRCVLTAPECDGRECSPDGCCGSCGPGSYCEPDESRCVPVAPDPDAGTTDAASTTDTVSSPELPGPADRDTTTTGDTDTASDTGTGNGNGGSGGCATGPTNTLPWPLALLALLAILRRHGIPSRGEPTPDVGLRNGRPQ